MGTQQIWICPLLHGLVEKFDLSMKSLTIINLGSNVGLNYQHQFFGRGCGEGIYATDSWQKNWIEIEINNLTLKPIIFENKQTNILMIKVKRTDRRRAKEMLRNGFLPSEYAQNILGKVHKTKPTAKQIVVVVVGLSRNNEILAICLGRDDTDGVFVSRASVRSWRPFNGIQQATMINLPKFRGPQVSNFFSAEVFWKFENLSDFNGAELSTTDCSIAICISGLHTHTC